MCIQLQSKGHSTVYLPPGYIGHSFSLEETLTLDNLLYFMYKFWMKPVWLKFGFFCFIKFHLAETYLVVFFMWMTSVISIFLVVRKWWSFEQRWRSQTMLNSKKYFVFSLKSFWNSFVVNKIKLSIVRNSNSTETLHRRSFCP